MPSIYRVAPQASLQVRHHRGPGVPSRTPGGLLTCVRRCSIMPFLPLVPTFLPYL